MVAVNPLVAAEVACRLVHRMQASNQMSCHCHFTVGATEAAAVDHLSPSSTAVAVAADVKEAVD